MYVCRYWVEHLEFGSVSASGLPLADVIMDFVNHRFLYWVEVFSLKEQMSTASMILRNADDWARVRCFSNVLWGWSAEFIDIELRTKVDAQICECIWISNNSECSAHLSLSLAIFSFRICGPAIYV